MTQETRSQDQEGRHPPGSSSIDDRRPNHAEMLPLTVCHVCGRLRRDVRALTAVRVRILADDYLLEAISIRPPKNERYEPNLLKCCGDCTLDILQSLHAALRISHPPRYSAP